MPFRAHPADSRMPPPENRSGAGGTASVSVITFSSSTTNICTFCELSLDMAHTSSSHRLKVPPKHTPIPASSQRALALTIAILFPQI